jgi:hypothetical protein
MNHSIIIKAYLVLRYAFFSQTGIYRLIIIFSLIQAGCSKEVEIDLSNTKSIVLNSVFNPNKVFSFNMSLTASPLNNYDSINGQLHFFLYEEDKIILNTLLQSDILETDFLPKPGKKYTVEVISDSFPSIRASDSIPNLVQIDDAYLIFPAGVDAYGDYLAEANVTFTDPIGEANYYELIITIGTDKDFYWSSDYQTTDRVLLNEGDLDYNPDSFFFSDELFNGEQYTMRIKHPTTGNTGSGFLKPYQHFATLRSVSKSYYLYRKYFTRHAYNQQFQDDFLDLIFKGEPQNMYTNIENGYGIFAGYQETTQELVFNHE